MNTYDLIDRVRSTAQELRFSQSTVSVTTLDIAANRLLTLLQDRDTAEGQLQEARKELSRVRAELTTAQTALTEARAEIEAAWFGIEHSYHIESRELITKESKTNGFKYPLAQAVHTIWKREPKVNELRMQIAAALRNAVDPELMPSTAITLQGLAAAFELDAIAGEPQV